MAFHIGVVGAFIAGVAVGVLFAENPMSGLVALWAFFGIYVMGVLIINKLDS